MDSVKLMSGYRVAICEFLLIQIYSLSTHCVGTRNEYDSTLYICNANFERYLFAIALTSTNIHDMEQISVKFLFYTQWKRFQH